MTTLIEQVLLDWGLAATSLLIRVLRPLMAPRKPLSCPSPTSNLPTTADPASPTAQPPSTVRQLQNGYSTSIVFHLHLSAIMFYASGTLMARGGVSALARAPPCAVQGRWHSSRHLGILSIFSAFPFFSLPETRCAYSHIRQHPTHRRCIILYLPYPCRLISAYSSATCLFPSAGAGLPLHRLSRCLLSST